MNDITCSLQAQSCYNHRAIPRVSKVKGISAENKHSGTSSFEFVGWGKSERIVDLGSMCVAKNASPALSDALLASYVRVT